MRSSKKSTSGSTWPCFVVNVKCFSYAVLLPLVMSWQFLLMFYWCLDPALIGIDRHWSELRRIERNWSALIGNNRHWETFRINAMILIGIDRHWSALGNDRGSPENDFESMHHSPVHHPFRQTVTICPVLPVRWLSYNCQMPVRCPLSGVQVINMPFVKILFLVFCLQTDELYVLQSPMNCTYYWGDRIG